MNRTQHEFILTDYAKYLIRFKSRQLRRRHDCQCIDLEDLQQDLWLALIQAAEQFDSSRGAPNTFVDRVVNTAVAMLLRHHQRQKRGHRLSVTSLDSVCVPSSNTLEPLATAVSADDLARRTGTTPVDEAARREDAEAVQHALAQMPDEMRDLCRRLMGGTVTSVASDLGISRYQVRQAIAAARPFLTRAGFELR